MPSPPDTKKPHPPYQVGDTSRLIIKVQQCIDDYGMLFPKDRVLVGVSGGPDSVALVHVLFWLRCRYAIDLGIAHLDHGLRPDTAAEETQWVKRLAEDLDVPFFSSRLATFPGHGSLEAWLRTQRYDFLEQAAAQQGFSKIAVGHQANDNAEAVLLHLLRGSGMRGISGIPPIRDNRIIRPLIRVTRKEILTYLDRLGITWLHDPTNMDVRFDRNRVRHQLIPHLEKNYNANLVQILNRTASICFEEDRWMDDQLAPLLTRSVAARGSTSLRLHVDSLIRAPLPVQRRIIRAALRLWLGDLQRFSAGHIEKILALLPDRQPHRRLHLPRRIEAERTVTDLCFRRFPGNYRGRPQAALPAEAVEFTHAIDTAEDLPAAIEIPEAGLRLTFQIERAIDHALDHEVLRSSDPHRAFFDLNRLTFPLLIRNSKPGDRISPFGLQGTQKLKKLFIDHKIPKPERPRLPLVIDGDTILWVVGVRRSGLAVVDEQTSRVLRIEAQAIDRVNDMKQL